MSNVLKVKDSLYFHPGYYLNELSEQTKEELRHRLAFTNKEFKQLLNGKRNLDVYDCDILGHMFNTSSKYWMNLQKTFYKGVKLKEEVSLFYRLKRKIDKIDKINLTINVLIVVWSIIFCIGIFSAFMYTYNDVKEEESLRQQVTELQKELNR